MTKSKVDRPSGLKYLGFGFYFDARAHQFKAKPHARSVEKFKARMKQLTSRSWGVMGFDSPEALAAACDAAHAKVDDIRTKMKSVEASIKETKEFRDYVLNYHKTRYVIDELKACKNEKARQKYRGEHDSDFIILNAAKRYFDSKGLKKLPSYKALQAEVEQLIPYVLTQNDESDRVLLRTGYHGRKSEQICGTADFSLANAPGSPIRKPITRKMEAKS